MRRFLPWCAKRPFAEISFVSRRKTICGDSSVVRRMPFAEVSSAARQNGAFKARLYADFNDKFNTLCVILKDTTVLKGTKIPVQPPPQNIGKSARTVRKRYFFVSHRTRRKRTPDFLPSSRETVGSSN